MDVSDHRRVSSKGVEQEATGILGLDPKGRWEARLDVRADQVRLALDLRATEPSVDREGRGQVAFEGRVVAPRVPLGECYRVKRSGGCW